ncbi:FUSC family protein [Adhaeribacter aerolatus]|uniref:FUSC family protein n=1 Tax=Adhaeribacter aerolatus TaxID=670289 RepID=UPI0021D003EB|nr:FUSC family protein [Adhaeribacter aerolatus]
MWQRSLQRVIGTLVGLSLTWLILYLQPSLLAICISIILLQSVVELLVVRNYGIAVVFITILTIFLAESGETLTNSPNDLIFTRFLDILTGSVIGAVGGWILYNEKLHFITTRQLRKTRMVILRRK